MVLSENNPLYKCWKFISLMIGNSKQFNCKAEGYRGKLTLSVMTVYLLAFTVGLFAGDLSGTKFIEVEAVFGILSTIAVYSLGFSVLYECWMKSEPGHRGSFPSLVSLAMIGSQTALVFNVFSAPVENMFYYFGSFITMLFVYSLVHKKKFVAPKSAPDEFEHHHDGGYISLKAA